MKTRTKWLYSLCCALIASLLALFLVCVVPLQRAHAETEEKVAAFDPNIAGHLSITYGWANVEVRLIFAHPVAEGSSYNNFLQPISWHTGAGAKPAEWVEKVQSDGSYASAMDEILFDGKSVRYHLEHTTMAGGINPVDATFVDKTVLFMIDKGHCPQTTSHTITFTKDYVFPTGYSFANDTTILVPAGGGDLATVVNTGVDVTLSSISKVTENGEYYTFDAQFSNALNLIAAQDVTEALADKVSIGNKTVAELNATAAGNVQITAEGTTLSFRVKKSAIDALKLTFSAGIEFPCGNRLAEGVSKSYSFGSNYWVGQEYAKVEKVAPIAFKTDEATHLTIYNNGANVNIMLQFAHPVVGEANPDKYNNFLQPMSWHTGAGAKSSEWVDRVLTDGTYDSVMDKILFDGKSVREHLALSTMPNGINPVDANFVGSAIGFMINTPYYGQGAHTLVLKEGLILPSGYYVEEDVVILCTAGANLVLNQTSSLSLAETGKGIAFAEASKITEEGDWYSFDVSFSNVLFMGMGHNVTETEVLSQIKIAGKTAAELGADVELSASYATLSVRIKKTVFDSNMRISFSAGIPFPSGNTLSSAANRTYLKDKGIWFAAVEDIEVSGLEDGGMKMSYGETRDVVASALPQDAAVKKLSYSSSDESIVEILPNGRMTAVGVGTVTITVASVGNPEVKVCFPVVVTKIPLTNIVLGQTASTRRIGVNFDIVVNYQPANVSVKGVTFESSNQAVAVVDANGKVTTVGPGTCTITVTYTDDPSKTATYTLTVVKSVASLEITEPTKVSYESGESFDAAGLKVTAVYDDGSKKELSASEYTVTGYSASTLGEQIITVSYEGVTGEFVVEVKPATEKPEEKKGCGKSADGAMAAILALGVALLTKMKLV